MSAFAETAFVDSAACGDLDEVRSLLAATDPALSPDIINKTDKDGKNAFHYACLNDDANLLKILLADPRVDVLLTSKSQDTGLHMAALYAAQEALALLFADGRIDINSQNKFGETPLHLCAGSGDKGAAKTITALLQRGASMTIVDKWQRGPLDVSLDNAESPVIAAFNAYLQDDSQCSAAVRAEVAAITARTKEAQATLCQHYSSDEGMQARKDNAKSLFGQLTGAGGAGAAGGMKGGLLGGLAGVQLKKTNTVVKTMFKAEEGSVGGASSGSSSGGAGVSAVGPADKRKALSKLVDFPGDLDEIRTHLGNKSPDPENSAGINPAGADSYGLTALHKFASWNKTDYLDLLLPTLSPADLETRCPEGKTALHYAVEMASVAAVKVLVAAGVDVQAVDGKGRKVGEILDAAAPSGIIERLKLALVKA